MVKNNVCYDINFLEFASEYIVPLKEAHTLHFLIVISEFAKVKYSTPLNESISNFNVIPSISFRVINYLEMSRL